METEQEFPFLRLRDANFLRGWQTSRGYFLTIFQIIPPPPGMHPRASFVDQRADLSTVQVVRGTTNDAAHSVLVTAADSVRPETADT